MTLVARVAGRYRHTKDGRGLWSAVVIVDFCDEVVLRDEGLLVSSKESTSGDELCGDVRVALPAHHL